MTSWVFTCLFVKAKTRWYGPGSRRPWEGAAEGSRSLPGRVGATGSHQGSNGRTDEVSNAASSTCVIIRPQLRLISNWTNRVAGCKVTLFQCRTRHQSQKMSYISTHCNLSSQSLYPSMGSTSDCEIQPSPQWARSTIIYPFLIYRVFVYCRQYWAGFSEALSQTLSNTEWGQHQLTVSCVTVTDPICDIILSHMWQLCIGANRALYMGQRRGMTLI